MSDNPGDTDSRAEEREDGTKSRSLKDATHILKAEALRRYQLENAEYDSEGAKTDDGREGSSSDKNVWETEKNGEILDSENPDSPSKGTDDDLNVTDRNGDSANDEESRQDGSFGKDSAKPNEGNALEDSVYGDSNKSDKENVQKSDITEKEGGKPGSDVKDQDTDRGTDSVKEGETANEISSSKPQSEDTWQVSNSQDKPAHVRGSRPSSARSRPVSSKARPTSGSEGSKKGEEGYQKPSSRPGSRDGNRSRPGSGADKRAKDEEQTQQQASGRGGSGTGRRSRPQSGDKRGAAGQGSGKVTQDGSTIESPGDTIAKKDGDLSSDGIIQTTDDLSQSKTNEGEIKEGNPATGNAASAANINEGVSLTEGKDLTKQGQGHHSDKSVSEKVVSDNSTEKINVENNFTSKQTGADDKLSDDVSPPMSEESKSKDHDESKQNPDSPSNNKQDPAVAEGNKEEKEGEHSKESKRDKETAESFDGGGQVDVRSIGREDSSEVLQTKDDSKDSQEQIVTTDKGKSSAEPGEGKKEQDGDADKSESVELESEKAIKKADQEGEDQGDTEGSSDAKVKEEGREGDASVDKTDDIKKDEKKKNKKKAKEEGVEKQESLEEDREEKADGTTKTDGKALQPGEPKQTAPGDAEEEAERILPDDFYYDFDELVSKAFSTEGIPPGLLSFYHSFGFECTKRSNLHVLDENCVLFSAGNSVEILNMKTQEQTHIRTTGGGGIGAVAVDPSRKYFAVAEKGVKPNINIFEYPSLKLHRILRDGTEEGYAHLDFSPKGDKLASVGSAPDYMLTVWDWRNEQVILRSKAFSQDIYKVAFSPEDEGHLCTSGSGHIRFWTMANTFTGLKLQGQIGKFGAKEISDIEGFVELPDGKVLSGSEWGNMLLWDGGLIKVEISKKGRKPCHVGMIEQFFMDEGELMTIGADGFVKVWDFESIDNADTTEEGQLFEMDPMYELKVGTDVKLLSMVKAVNTEAPIWYAQDAAGGIWKLDLSFTHTSHAPERMFSYHAGPITGLETSPVAPFVATIGVDYTVRVYNYLSKTPMCQAKYNSGGSSLLWVPKVVDTKGTKLLAGFADGVVRLLALNKVDPSQLRTKKSKQKYELNLEQVFKPHTKAVTVLTIDEQGEILATGSDDCTVFFFTVGETYKPIGFIETASPVASMEWSHEAKAPKSVLISCKDGTVLHVEAPDPGKYDTSKTFHLPLTNLKTKEYHFKSVKDKLRKAEEEAQKAKEEEEKRKKKEAERARRRARGLEEEEEQEKEEKEGEQEGEEQKEGEENEEEQHKEPGEIIKGFYHGKTEQFWISMGGWDAGYLYQCEFDEGKKSPPAEGQEDTRDEPVKSIPVDNSNDTPIRSVCFSHSGKFLLFGMDDGVLRIHPLDGSNDLEDFSTFWALNVHDNHHGGIRHIKTSFDDKYVFTAGMDGNFFVFRFMDKAVEGLKVSHKVSIPSAKKLIGEEGEEIVKKIDDIDDPNHYSIELEKQKAEHDRLVKLAEEKKQNIRRKIGNLRRAFKELMTRNQKLPPHVQLMTDEFEIDPDLVKEQKIEVDNKIELVRKEMAWEAEKKSIGLKKLQKRFKDEVECDRIVLRAFLTPHLVTAFRAAKPDYLHQLLQEAEGTGSGEGTDGGVSGRKSFTSAAQKAAQMKRRATQEKMSVNQQQQQQQQAPMTQGQLGSKVANALAKAEARRQKRLARQAEWDELYRSKPDEGYEDPKDLAAIKEARENMGDYKLKTAKDYVVPESLRVNAEKKRIQLLKLLDQIHHYKFEFNHSFLALRDKKIKIIKELKEVVANVEEVQRKIDPYSRRTIPKIPEMMPDECPEKRLEYTREQLLEFKKQLDEKVHQGEQGAEFGGFGGFGGGTTEPSKLAPTSKPGTQQRDRAISSVSVHSSGRPRSSLSTLTDKGTPEPTLEDISEDPSLLEQEMQYEEQIRLQYEQDVLIDKITNTLEKFDADLRYLRHDKMHLEVAVKCADLRQVTLFEEFMLLKEFEKRENSFANKVNTKLSEKEEMQEKVEDCQLKLDSKKQDIEKLQEQEKALYTTFSAALGENNKFESFLTRVFKKKIKRAKKKTQAQEGSDEESEDEESDEDLSSSDEEDSDAEELDDSVCPPGCDQALFDQVCQLRERRLDLEEKLAEEKKTSETLKKESDALVKKAKIIDGALKTAEADLEAFQREKQQKLNELDVVVVLRFHQIQYMINSVLPQDLSQCLVFNSPGLVRLQHRIKELEKEKAEQKRLYREHRQTHVELIRDKKVQEARIGELEEKVRNMLMLKFGRLVDLEKLENVTVNRTVEELKEKLRQQESKSAAEIAKWNSKIDSYKGKVTQLTRENTQRLDTFTVLLQEKKELEQMLNSRQKSLGTEFTGSRKADIRERQRLVQLVQLQAQEIDALKDEITLLSRKGGHILPPAQPPLPPGQTPIPNQ